jgi:hypothetical protein
MSLNSTQVFASVSLGSISVNQNLIADLRENILSTISNTYTYATNPTILSAVQGTISVNQNLIADSREMTVSTVSTTYSLTSQPVINTGSSGTIAPSISQISSTPTASEQLTKVQIWTIS